METPGVFHEFNQSHFEIMAYEAAQVHARHYEDHREALSEQLLGLIENGREVTIDAYDAALMEAAEWRNKFSQLIEPEEVILTLAAAGEAPSGIGATGSPVFNVVWTVLHLPTINLPVGTGSSGLPIGLQLVGSIGQEDNLVSAARWIVDQLGLTAS
jgi:Asp-tRNA(Asn)/Glu-tRNA(Gln) amidotransferase A subunit family amidase